MEELLLDIVNGIWAAEHYNDLCPQNKIALPATEAEVAQSLIEATGQDFIGELACTPFAKGITLKDHARMTVEAYLKGGCMTDEAIRKRAIIEHNLSKYAQLFQPG
jgi:hypothetical protein